MAKQGSRKFKEGSTTIDESVHLCVKGNIKRNQWINESIELKWLTHFIPSDSSYTPKILQKTKGFLMFSEGIERANGHEIG